MGSSRRPRDLLWWYQYLELVRIEEAKHEIYQEADAIRGPYLEKIFQFLDDNR